MSNYDKINALNELIYREKYRQEHTIELIASENFVSHNVLRAVGSVLTNKYAEGRPGKRYYGGCEIVDEIEEMCEREWLNAFSASGYHCNVQPHSGSQANAAAYAALLEPGDTILSMSLENGGHLSHGSPVNFSGKTYNVVFYGTDENGYIDMDDVYEKALKYDPKLILAGASAYPRQIDFFAFKRIADEVGAYTMADIAHIAGLVVARQHASPFAAGFDIVTTTTHKTLRGPRGGLIFCKNEHAKKVDSAVFPCIQGGPLMHVIAGKTVAAVEAQQPEYYRYIRDVVDNCQAMANRFAELGFKVVTGGTDNHLLLLDLSDGDVSGKLLQDTLDRCDITLNKNCVPNEKRSPMQTSGVRIGTAAMTTRGMTAQGFITTVEIIKDVYNALYDNNNIEHAVVEARARAYMITKVLNGDRN